MLSGPGPQGGSSAFQTPGLASCLQLGWGCLIYLSDPERFFQGARRCHSLGGPPLWPHCRGLEGAPPTVQAGTARPSGSTDTQTSHGSGAESGQELRLWGHTVTCEGDLRNWGWGWAEQEGNGPSTVLPSTALLWRGFRSHGFILMV